MDLVLPEPYKGGNTVLDSKKKMCLIAAIKNEFKKWNKEQFCDLDRKVIQTREDYLIAMKAKNPHDYSENQMSKNMLTENIKNLKDYIKKGQFEFLIVFCK